LKLSDGTDWLMKPVSHGYCRYESLMDGKLGLTDVARMNEAIDVAAENARRLKGD